MRRFIVHSHESDFLDDAGFAEAANVLFEDANVTDQKINADKVPELFPYFRSYDTEEWLETTREELDDTNMGTWLSESDREERHRLMDAIADSSHDEKDGFLLNAEYTWRRPISKVIHEELRVVPQDLSVLLGQNAVELFQANPDLFENNWQRFGSKLVLAQTVSAFIVQRAASEPYPRGWLYQNSFHETLLPNAHGMPEDSLVAGIIDGDDPRLVIGQNSWFAHNCHTPVTNKKVPFSPISAEEKITMGDWAAIPRVISQCMAFLDYALVDETNQRNIFTHALQRVYAQSDKRSLPLFGELFGITDDEIESDAQEVLQWRSNSSSVLDPTPNVYGGSMLAAHAVFIPASSYYHPDNEGRRSMIYFTKDKNRPTLHMVQGEYVDRFAIEPDQHITFDVDDISHLLESLLYVNQTQSMNYSPQITLRMIQQRFGTVAS